MSDQAFPGPQQKHQDSCWLCGRMLTTGYHFVCHVCGSTYCYSHMPAKCGHRPRRQLPLVKSAAPKA